MENKNARTHKIKMGKRINFKKILTKIGLCSILITFTQCASSQKVDDMAPIKFNNPYFQSWVSGSVF